MTIVTDSMAVSLDGYIVGPDGSFAWTAPSEELFGVTVDEVKGLGAYLLGRRLYETMVYWEDVEQNPGLDFSTREWSRRWRALPKVVLSTTLTGVRGNARLASGDIGDVIRSLRTDGVDGDIALGGATVAAQAAEQDLIDEYRIRVLPVLVGGGIRYFPELERRTDLELVENRTVDGNVLYLRYRVVRDADPAD